MNIKSLFTVIVLLFFSSLACANIIYSFDRSLGQISWAGTIETDGTLGRITKDNIEGFTFAFINAPTAPLSVSFSVDAVTATASGLFFAPLTTTPAYFRFNSGILDSGEFQCVSGEYVNKLPEYELLFDGTRTTESVYRQGGYAPCPVAGQSLQEAFDANVEVATYTGSVPIGLRQSTSVPEPTTLALLALGLAGLGWSRRRQCPRIG